MSSKSARKRENDLINHFTGQIHREVFERLARGRKIDNVVATALCGQDRVLADYLLQANARFLLIEFKANESCIVSELDKDLRGRLCTALATDAEMLSRSNDIHQIAWGNFVDHTVKNPYETGRRQRIKIASYPAKVGPLFQFKLLDSPTAEYDTEDFVIRFLDKKKFGANAERFQQYLSELYALAEADSAGALSGFEGSIYMYISEEGAVLPRLNAIEFRGLADLYRLAFGPKQNIAPNPYAAGRNESDADEDIDEDSYSNGRKFKM